MKKRILVSIEEEVYDKSLEIIQSKGLKFSTYMEIILRILIKDHKKEVLKNGIVKEKKEEECIQEN